MNHIEDLSDFAPIEQLQHLMELFYKATKIPVGILAPDGRILVATGWQEICTCFHRQNANSLRRCVESATINAPNLNPKKPFSYTCQNGLVEVGYPIYLHDKHIATIMLGQFFYKNQPLDEAFFIKQAKEFGYNTPKYLEALRKVPVFTESEINNIMDYYMAFANMLSQMSLQNYLLKLQLKKTDQKQNAFPALLAMARNQRNLKLCFQYLNNTGNIKIIEYNNIGNGITETNILLPDFLVFLSVNTKIQLLRKIAQIKYTQQPETSLFNIKLDIEHEGVNYSGMLVLQQSIATSGEPEISGVIFLSGINEFLLHFDYRLYCSTLFDKSATPTIVLDKMRKPIYLNTSAHNTLKKYRNPKINLLSYITEQAQILNLNSKIFLFQDEVLGIRLKIRINKADHLHFANVPLYIISIEDFSTDLNYEMAMANHEEKVNATIEATNAGLWEYDPVLGEYLLSSKIIDTLGYNSYEVNAKPKFWESIIFADDLQMYLSGLEKLILGKTKKLEIEYRVFNSFGHLRWFSTTAVLFTNTNQPNNIIIGAHSDITESKEAELAIEHLLHETEKANLQKSMFVANISNEIRNPLNTIISTIDTSSVDLRTAGFSQSSLNSIKQSAENLMGLAEDLLLVSKIEVGSISLNEVPLNFLKFLDGITKHYRLVASNQGSLFQFQISGSVPEYIIADQFFLKQAFINLLSNAMSLSKPGKTIFKIQAFNYLPGWTKIFVQLTTHNSIINPERLHQLFDFHYRNYSGQQGASQLAGVGFSISKRILEKLNGNIAVGISNDNICDLIISFNSRIISEEIIWENEEDRKNLETALQANLLVIENDYFEQKHLRDLINSTGAHCMVVNNGDEAMALLENKGYFFDAVACKSNYIPDAYFKLINRQKTIRLFQTKNELAASPTDKFDFFVDISEGSDELAAVLSLLSNKIGNINNNNTSATTNYQFIDLDTIAQREAVLGRDIFTEVVKVFISDIEPKIRQIKEFNFDENIDDVKEMMHKVKNSIGYFASIKTIEKINYIDTQIHSNTNKKPFETQKELIFTIEELTNELKRLYFDL